MKKLFVFAIAATCVVAACNKNPLPTPEDETQVAVQFNTKNIEASVTKTKAPITGWDGSQTLYIYGFAVNRQGGTDNGAQIGLGSGRYTLNSPFINNVSAVSPLAGESAINVYNPQGGATEPFYYDINTSVVYDFYGYYFGDATLHKDKVIMADDAITYPVTIDGTQDLLYATTNKEEDLKTGVEEHQAYGAWAARRGVQPTLNFQHALSQFTFLIKRGQGSYNGELTVQNVQILGSNEGNFTVVGATPGYVAATDTDMTDSFILPGNSGSSAIVLDSNTSDYLPVDGALMVAPEQETIRVKVTLKASNYSPNEGVIVYEFDLKATDVKKDSQSANITKFAAGHSYTAKVIVYGPEEVEFDVTLGDWVEGGEVEYDPDNENNAPAK